VAALIAGMRVATSATQSNIASMVSNSTGTVGGYQFRERFLPKSGEPCESRHTPKAFLEHVDRSGRSPPKSNFRVPQELRVGRTARLTERARARASESDR
jgi:hypothetical protein